MVAEIRPNYEHEYAAISAVATKLGIGTPETVRKCVRRAEVDTGSRPGVTAQLSCGCGRRGGLDGGQQALRLDPLWGYLRMGRQHG
jgi:transposase-like protein